MTRKHGASIAAVVLGLVVAPGASAAAAGDAQAATDARRIGEGRGLYERYCASCHGEAGDGTGPVAETLKVPPADLTKLGERFGRPLNHGAVAERIDGRHPVAAHGSKEMPVWGDKLFGDVSRTPTTEPMTRATVTLLIDYLQSIQR